MAAPFLAFVLGIALAWCGSLRWAMTMFFVALGLSIGIFVSHMDSPLNLQF
jgi:hypothetical protein